MKVQNPLSDVSLKYIYVYYGLYHFPELPELLSFKINNNHHFRKKLFSNIVLSPIDYTRCI